VAGDKAFNINWWTYKHNNVFLMARKLNPKEETFSLGFQFRYKKKPGMSSGGVGTLVFLGIVFAIAGMIYLIYYLHR
jgi:hypothetical protein